MAIDYWYPTNQEAIAAVSAAAGVQYTDFDALRGSDPARCGGGGGYSYYTKYNPTKTYAGCDAGYVSCAGGQVMDVTGVCACPGGQTLVNGQCTNPCQSGTTKQLSASSLDSSGLMVITIGSGPTVSDGGCQYQCPDTPVDGLTYYNSTDMWNTYMCTATGQASQSTDKASSTVPADASKLEQPPAPTDPAQPTCQRLPTTGTNVCTGGNIPAGCSTIDGITDCVESSTMGGQTVKPTDEKNCQRLNGVTLCAVAPADAEFCGQVNGVTRCYSTTTKTNVLKTTETDPDGTVREITREADGVIGGQTKETVRATAPDGTVTITTKGGSGAGVDGSEELLKQIAGSLGKLADGQGDGTGECKDLECPQAFGGSGAIDQYTSEGRSYQDVINDFKSRVLSSQIANAANGVFSVNLTGGNCPVWSASVPLFGAITIDQQCSSVMQSIWPLIYGVLLATATFYAIRVAFL